MQLRLLMGVHLILVLLLHGLAPAPMDGTTTVAATKYVILPVGLLVRICKLDYCGSPFILIFMTVPSGLLQRTLAPCNLMQLTPVRCVLLEC